MAINEPADDDPAAEIQPDDLPPADDQIQPAADLPPDQPAHDDQDLPWHWVLVEERLFGVTPLGMVQHVLNQEAVYGFNEDGGDVFDLFYLTDNDENGNVDALIPDDYPVRTVECLTLLGSTLMNLREMVKNRSQIVFQIFENLMIIVGHNQETVTYLRQQDYLILTRVEEIIGFLYMVNKCGFTGAAWVLNRETEKSIEEHVKNLPFLRIKVFHGERGWNDEEWGDSEEEEVSEGDSEEEEVNEGDSEEEEVNEGDSEEEEVNEGDKEKEESAEGDEKESEGDEKESEAEGAAKEGMEPKVGGD